MMGESWTYFTPITVSMGGNDMMGACRDENSCGRKIPLQFSYCMDSPFRIGFSNLVAPIEEKQKMFRFTKPCEGLGIY
jgi:hypothetical protein